MKQRVLLLLIACLAALGFIWVRSGERRFMEDQGHRVLSDPDSYTREFLIREAALGHGLVHRTFPFYNWPHGMANPWTTPTTWVGLMLVKGAGLLLPHASPGELIRHASFWLGPVVGLLALLLWGALGYRLGGLFLAAAWMLAWPPLDDLVAVTRFGCADHHSLHLLLIILLVGLASAPLRTARAGLGMGLASGLLLWSAGFEMLPLWGATLLLAWLEVRTQPDTVTTWRWWWRTGTMVTTLALLIEFPSALLTPTLGHLSSYHIIFWLLGGALLELHARRPRTRTFALVSLALTLLGALVVVAVGAGFDLRHLLDLQNPEVARQLRITREYAPLWPGGWTGLFPTLFWKYGGLPLCVVALATRTRILPARLLWLVSLVIVYAALTWHQIRWADTLAVLLIVAAGWGLWEGRTRWKQGIWLALLLAVLPPWYYALRIAANARHSDLTPAAGPFSEYFALDAVLRCLDVQPQPAVLLAPWDYGLQLGAAGSVGVIGTGSWTNPDGLRDTHRLFTTPSEEEFNQLVRARGIHYLLLPAPAKVTQLIGQGYYVLHGQPPTGNTIAAAHIWRVATDTNLPTLACPDMNRYQPGWKLKDLSARREK